MSEINYENSRIEGGIEAFADVLRSDRVKPEIGQEPVPTPEAARRYARFVESVLDSQDAGRRWIEEDDQDLLAA